MYVLIITTIFTGLSTLIVALRLYTRFHLIKSPGVDDLLIVIALLSDLIFYAFVLVERNYGLGVPRSQLAPETIEGQLHYLWLSVPFYNLALIFAKLSALTLFVRLFRPRPFLLTCYISMGLLVIAGLWMTLSGFIFCVPVHDFWNVLEETRSRHCLPEGPVWFTNAGIQIATDLIILVLPMPLLWKLQMPRRQKWGIMLVFSLGIFVIATSSVRLYQLSIMITARDFTKTNSKAGVWSSLEANISIICVCLPPLHPLLSRVFSLCFLPQPLHSSPASRLHTNTTQLTERKPSIYDHYGSNHSPDGGVWYNELFTPGPASYSASIAKVNTNEEDLTCSNEDGIRVVRELRMQSDSVCPTPALRDPSPHARDYDLEKGEGSSNSIAGNGNTRSNPSIEWDLGDFQFPDYKERMNAPI